MKLIMLSLAIAIILSSCTATRTIYIKVPLPIPVQPKLITISALELACLSEDAFLKLVKRGLQRDEFEARLVAVLKSNNKPR